ncbi:MAG: hypothetical protein HYV07_32180 [Deltaproteobacteria bacterium]|nr:hypothetical protein [Deltaproteobacteria bacterium]
MSEAQAAIVVLLVLGQTMACVSPPAAESILRAYARALEDGDVERALELTLPGSRDREAVEGLLGKAQPLGRIELSIGGRRVELVEEGGRWWVLERGLVGPREVAHRFFSTARQVCGGSAEAAEAEHLRGLLAGAQHLSDAAVLDRVRGECGRITAAAASFEAAERGGTLSSRTSSTSIPYVIPYAPLRSVRFVTEGGALRVVDVD